MPHAIPHVLHYVWVGGNPMPDNFQTCYDSWKKYCPGFEIIRWDETNFDISSNRYAREAYAEKKWAFVSDYIRLAVLYQYGGIYLDTDAEIVRPIDCFLSHAFFSGFETSTMFPTAIMGAEIHNPYIGQLLSDYDGISFYKRTSPKKLNLKTNVVRITETTKKLFPNDFFDNGSPIEFLPYHILYPKDYFCPAPLQNSAIPSSFSITENTYAIHHFNGSWLDPPPLFTRLRRRFKEAIGEDRYYHAKKILGLKIRDPRFR